MNTNLVERLLPCPFCGSEAEQTFINHPYMDETYYCRCTACRIEQPTYGTREEAIAAWNRRTESRLALQGNAGDQEPTAYLVKNDSWGIKGELKFPEEMPEPAFEGDRYDVEIPLFVHQSTNASALHKALVRLERAVDLHLGRSASTQTGDLKGFAHSQEVRKELYAAHDEARAVISAATQANQQGIDIPPP